MTATAKYGAVMDLLTTEDKAAVLMVAGVPAGRAACIASRGPADFWAALSQHGMENVEQTWRNYPACWKLISDELSTMNYAPFGVANVSSGAHVTINNSGTVTTVTTPASRAFTSNDIYALNLHKRLTDNEADRISWYLSKHAPSSVRAFFEVGHLHGIQQVLRQAVNSMISVALVADAIDQGVGKLTIASELRSVPLVNVRSVTEQAETTMTTNSIASGFEKANAEVTAATFIRDKDNAFLQDICTAFNKSEKYGQLLQLFGVQPSIDSNKRLAMLRERWNTGALTGSRGNPALDLLGDLCASPKFAAQTVEELAAKMMKCDSTEVQTAVAAWIAAMADNKSAENAIIEASVDRHDELRTFFLKANLAGSEAEVQKCIDRLTREDIDVHEVKHMRRMTADDFRAAGFSLRLSKDIAAAVQNHK